MTEINDVKLSQLIPENLNRDGNVKACADALDPQLQEIALNVDAPSIYLHLDSLTSEQLDHMATQWDASVWRQSWPIEIKRNVINNVIRDKRKKGTLLAVKNAIESIGIIISITEWWQETPKATPHTFKVVASLSDFDGLFEAELQEDAIQLINDAKPVRSHYDFIIETRHSGDIGLIGLYRKLAYARVVDKNRDTQKYDWEEVPENSMGLVPMDEPTWAESMPSSREQDAVLISDQPTWSEGYVSGSEQEAILISDQPTWSESVVSMEEHDVN